MDLNHLLLLVKNIKKLDLAFLWNKMILLKNIRIPSVLKWFLIFVNFYICGSLLVAFFLWLNGDWVSTVYGLAVKLRFWPIFKSSLQMAFIMYILTHHNQVIKIIRNILSYAYCKMLIFGFFIGYLPAIVGYFTGKPPSSPDGIVTLPELFSNSQQVVTKLIPQITGSSEITLLTNPSLILVFAGLLVLFYKFWISYRRKILNGTSVPAFYPIVALSVATILLGIVCIRWADPDASRYLLPIYISVSLAISWILERLKKFSYLLAGILLCVYLGNSILAITKTWELHQSPHPYKHLIHLLNETKIKGGYADYWLAYYLTFLSQEKIIITPQQNDFVRNQSYSKYVQSLNKIVLLGKKLLPYQKNITIDGNGYRVIRQEVDNKLPIIFLEKN
ncbi:MAG: hypothetical protein AB1349_06385 [Elusimicrobiota bacterium]